MNTEKEWKKALNVADEDYNTWRSVCKDQSLTLWALKHKKIDLDKYMQWATTHYSIPCLKDSFIYTNPINTKLWNDVKDSIEWNETLVPLYSWEDKIFVGCVEPPDTDNNDFRPLLTSPKVLEFCWHKVQKLSKQETPDTENTVNYTLKDFEDDTDVKNEHLQDPDEHKDLKSLEELAEDELTGKHPNNATIIENITHIFSKKEKSNQSKEIYDQVFSKTKKYFSAAVVLSFNAQQFTPIKWTKSIKETTKPIDIKEPSLFRMLVLSNTPHHGPIVSNSQHEECFKEWGYNKLPKHVSLIPIHNHSDHQLCGAFLGVLKPSFVHRKYLSKIIQAIKPLKENLSPEESSLPKAA